MNNSKRFREYYLKKKERTFITIFLRRLISIDIHMQIESPVCAFAKLVIRFSLSTLLQALGIMNVNVNMLPQQQSLTFQIRLSWQDNSTKQELFVK